MKKRGMYLILIVLLVSLISFAVSQEEECNEDCQVDKAYSCLNDRVNNCSSLSLEEEIFSLLAVGDCEEELIDDSSNGECWPVGSCNLKTTSQAVLALRNAGEPTQKAEDWLTSKNISVSTLIWYLQIDADEESACTIQYSSLPTYSFTQYANKTLSSGPFGTCLSLTSDRYWLKISPSCYDETFTISCDKSFNTNLIYQKTDSSTFYISQTTTRASPGATAAEKVNSLCFSAGSSCNYEGTLWAALVLDSLEHDVSPYLPYLITMSENLANARYIPEAFLYALTGDFKSELLAKQKKVNNNYYWEASADKYYDTALALYPLQYDELPEKTNAKNWLLNVQTEEGCWDNTRNTAFILYSVWPSRSSSYHGGETGVDCEDAGYFCVSSISCEDAGGEILEDYGCAGSYKCCTQDVIQETCSEQLGEICNSEEICDGSTLDASGLDYGEICCMGICEAVEGGGDGGGGTQSDCENSNGVCRVSCDSDEEASFEACDISTDLCCKTKQAAGKRSFVGIIILAVLIILVVLAIVFRNKLKILWFKIRNRSKGGEGAAAYRPGPRFPPSFPSSL